jgi:hypothetical protein
VKIFLPKSKWWPQSKIIINVFNLNDQVKFLDVLKCGMSSAGVGWCYGKYESSICSIALNSTNTEHAWFFLSGGIPGTMYPRIPRVYLLF